MDGQDGLRCVDSVVLGQHTAGQVDKCCGADKNYKGGWTEQTAGGSVWGTSCTVVRTSHNTWAGELTPYNHHRQLTVFT